MQIPASHVVGLEARARVHAGGEPRRADDVQERVLEAEEEAVEDAEAVIAARLGQGAGCGLVVAQDRRGLRRVVCGSPWLDGLRIAWCRHGFQLLRKTVKRRSLTQKLVH